MGGDLNAKHVDWNSRLNTRRGKLLRDYANETSCLIFGPDTPTTNKYNSSAAPDVLDIVIVKDHPFLVYLTSCSALSLCHLPVLIDTACRSSFQHSPDCPDFRRTEWAKFQTHLEGQILSTPNCTTGWQSTRASTTSPAPFWRLWRHLPSVARVMTHGLRYRPAFRMRYAWRISYEGGGRSSGTTLWRLRLTACKGRWPAGSMSGGTTSGVPHSIPSIPKTNQYGGWLNGQWDFLLRLLPWSPRGNRSLRLSESGST